MRQLAAVLLTSALISACGTTLAHVPKSADSLSRRDAVTQPTSNTDTAVIASSGRGANRGADGNTPATTPQPGTLGPTDVGSAAVGAGHDGHDGPGVTADRVTIGVSYYQSAAAANAALGAKGVDTGDPVKSTRVLLNAINASGGIAGRRVEALFYAIDPQSSTPYANEAQAECAYFTQDHHVLAVIDGAPAADARSCLQQHGVIYLGGQLLASSLHPNEVDAYASRLDRVFSAMVPTLASHGWFAAWDRTAGGPGVTAARVGVVTTDNPDADRAIDGVLIPALRQAGHAPAAGDVIRIAGPGGFSDDGAAAAAVDNAVLKLNADGVDHVILNDGNGSMSLLFNNYAYTQNYFPRYGGDSGSAWQVLLSAGDIQARTLTGAMGIGWQPLFDLPYQPGDGPASNPARHRCFATFAQAGIAHTDDGTAGGQAEGCDVAFLLPAVFRGSTGPINLTTFLDGVDRLGAGYPLASGLGSRFAPDQHDGTGAYSFMQFDSTCGCVGYRGPVVSAPH